MNEGQYVTPKPVEKSKDDKNEAALRELNGKIELMSRRIAILEENEKRLRAKVTRIDNSHYSHASAIRALQQDIRSRNRR